MDGHDRIWITGVGLVTALGNDVATIFPRLVRGERGFAPLTLFDTTGQRASMVASVDPSHDFVVPEADTEQWSRTSLFARKAAHEALAQAGLSPADAPGKRFGLVVASTTGGMFETESLLAELHADPQHRASLVRMISQPLTATADRFAECFGPFTRVRSLCSACSSGANAFVVGARWLLAGLVDAVLVGGTDGLCRLTLSGFNALAAADPDECRPFDVNRRGLNLGEGAGFAVLERATSVRDRTPLAELAGWAIGAEAHHITNPDPTGESAARVIGQSLRSAGLSPRAIDYVNAHGTGTPLNDAMESAGLRLALGAEVERIPVSSSKGQIGHTLGAAGAVEAIFSALAVKHGTLLPTMGLTEPDPACPLVHVLHEGRSARVRAALSNSFGFGGMDTVLTLTEPELGPPHATGQRRVVITGAGALTARGVVAGRSAAPLVDGSRDQEPVAPRGALPEDLSLHLDAPRARRLDRGARLASVVADKALQEAAILERSPVGIVLGIAFGSLDPSAAFMHRVFEKGPRMASPAEFPNLVPSSPVGHVSIYLGLRGVALSTADLATSGESALLQAWEFVAGGDADVLVAGGVEEASALVERIRFCLDESSHERPRSEGAATLVLETEEHARDRGQAALARVVNVATWNGSAPASLEAPHKAAKARVVMVHDDGAAAAALVGSGWEAVPRTVVASSAGEHEGIGSVALVGAIGLLARGDADEVLVVGVAPGRGYAFTLARP